MGAPAHLALSPKAEGEVSLQGKVIIHMVTITLSSSGCSHVSLWNHRSGTMEVGWVLFWPGEGGGLPNLSLLHCSLPSLGVPACMEHPLCLSRKSLEVILHQEAGSFCIEEQMAPCPRVGQSHVLQRRQKCFSELPGVASILPLPPTGSLSGAACAFLVTGTAVALQRMRKHKTGTGKRLWGEAPWRCCICSISFFSDGILISQLKRTASCRVWLDLLCFLQISQPIIISCCAPGNVYFWALFYTRLHRLEL